MAVCAKLVEMTLERRRTRERRELMLGELQHRVRNVFASVGALAHFSAENTADISEFSTAFRGRLNALDIAHSLMFDSSGAELSTVLKGVLEPYGERYEIAGPRIILAPEAASSLSMAFHELATNAAKYGSFSNEVGKLSIVWDVTPFSDEELFTLRWIEEGGPKVSLPSRRGFGGRAIEKLLASDIEGRIRLDFAPEGLRCEITAPLGNKLGRREQAPLH
jgi:two-component system, chemotaxis family, CheB/CheR fusion protein